MRDAATESKSEAWEEILRRAQRLDVEALDAIVEKYSPRLYGFLYRLTRHRDDAEEMVQEVLVRMVRTIPEYRHSGRFEPWLFRIAMNLARDRGRRMSRAPGMTSLEGGGVNAASGWDRVTDAAAPSPGHAAELTEQIDQLQRALETLPDAERDVVLMRHYGQLSFGEIAEMMGTPLGTALARGHRGLAKLRKVMESSP